MKAIIFDCDGVLVDSEGLKFRAWQAALAQYGISYTLDEYLKVVGRSHDEIIKTIAVPVKDHSRIVEEKEAFYVGYQKEEISAIEDGVSLVKQASRVKDIKVGLATSDSLINTLTKLNMLGLGGLFDQIVTSDDLIGIDDSTGVNKPKPYIYQIACKRLGVLPSDTVVIEDSEAGVEASYLAGCKTIAVPNRYTKHQDFSLAYSVGFPKSIDSLL